MVDPVKQIRPEELKGYGSICQDHIEAIAAENMSNFKQNFFSDCYRNRCPLLICLIVFVIVVSVASTYQCLTVTLS